MFHMHPRTDSSDWPINHPDESWFMTQHTRMCQITVLGDCWCQTLTGVHLTDTTVPDHLVSWTWAWHSVSYQLLLGPLRSSRGVVHLHNCSFELYKSSFVLRCPFHTTYCLLIYFAVFAILITVFNLRWHLSVKK